MSLDQSPYVKQWLQMEDGKVVVKTGKVDIGQRISTALMQIVSEELTLPYDRIKIASVRTGTSPDEGITSGSNSVEHSGKALRLAAATLRAWLLGQLMDAADDPGDWHLHEGTFQQDGRNAGHDIVDLMGSHDFSELKVDSQAIVSLAKTTMPQPPMRGSQDMVAGKFIYVHDIDVPNMLHARVIRAPHARARLLAVDEAVVSRLKSEGISVVRDGAFIAVAGPKEWPVVQAASRLGVACDWDQNGGLPDKDVFERLAPEHAKNRLLVANGLPMAEAPIPQELSNPHYKARFERPYLMHAALAPSAAFAQWHGAVLHITCHSQGIYPLRESIAGSLDLALEQVVITHAPGSGCYGHNGADDAALDAALVARALPGSAILLKWSRDEEHAWEPYAPAMAVSLAANVAPDKRVSEFSADVFSDTHRGRPREGPNRAGPARLLANQWRNCDVPRPKALPNMNRHGGMHRNLDPIYPFGKKRLVKNLVDGLPHRTSALRCLGATTNIFALESMMDELADHAACDPIIYRKSQLDDVRALAVLDRLQILINALGAPTARGGRGIAYAQYKNEMTRVAVFIDIEMSDAGVVLLQNAIIVADAGRVIDRDGLCAQLEGGFVQGASWALCEEVQWDRDGITSRDWDSYPVLRFDRIPQIKVDLIETHDQPSVGAGEASPGPTIAAIANAVHHATGIRMRRLPLTAEAIRQQALLS